MVRALRLGLAAAAVAFTASLAHSNPLKSLYTTVELKACKQVRQTKDGDRTWLCEGLPGFPVYLAEGDLRHFVSAGRRAENRRAATQTLGPFNSIFEHGSERATIEWRIVRRDGRPVPFAAIVHFHTFNEGRRGNVLVVFKVDERETCQVSHIDALANRDAIVLARQVADERARGFNCRKDPQPEGATGRSPM